MTDTLNLKDNQRSFLERLTTSGIDDLSLPPYRMTKSVNQSTFEASPRLLFLPVRAVHGWNNLLPLASPQLPSRVM